MAVRPAIGPVEVCLLSSRRAPHDGVASVAKTDREDFYGWRRTVRLGPCSQPRAQGARGIPRDPRVLHKLAAGWPDRCFEPVRSPPRWELAGFILLRGSRARLRGPLQRRVPPAGCPSGSITDDVGSSMPHRRCLGSTDVAFPRGLQWRLIWPRFDRTYLFGEDSRRRLGSRVRGLELVTVLRGLARRSNDVDRQERLVRLGTQARCAVRRTTPDAVQLHRDIAKPGVRLCRRRSPRSIP
jgi:hypothetical protein